MHIYQVIIGSEILNRRRADRHFDFLSSKLLERGERLYASFVIADEMSLIKKIFTLIKNDPQSYMFSFGGIGSTPDDLTREAAAEVFTRKPPKTHEGAKRLILEQFGKEAYPHRIGMAELPEGAALLDNPVNRVPGFSLQGRFFFVPGFPKMAHPMVLQALDEILPKPKRIYRTTFTALTSENDLIEMMRRVPKEIELSSLPAFCGKRRIAVISLAGEEEESVRECLEEFISFMESKNIEWLEGDRHDDPDICDPDD